MTREAPAWLADLQRRFGAVIRTPLDRSSGTLTATPSAYDEALASEAGRERLSVYNRQYWFRLFDVMHSAFPLTTRLFGAWAFNEHAQRFFLEHAPRGHDIDRAPDGFDAFLERTLPADLEARGACVESARIDAAFRAVFRAPVTTPFVPSAEDAAGLLDKQLTPSPSVALVEEHWPLLELRRAALARVADARVELPEPLPHVRSWALVRKDEATLELALEPREAELFRLLGATTIRDALARLEASCDADERAELPNKARAWLARSVALGFWISCR